MINVPKGVLRLAALKMLSESSLSGTGLAEQIRLLRELEKRGRYKPKRPIRYQTPRRIREKARESEKKAEILPVP
ncbi:MAG: hypothetical protein JRN59_08940, partial [Nitrososphaerota archaeon]|nr:hypothetical protein [Nitrososphaerota archaeon]